MPTSALLLLMLAVGAVSHGYGLFNYPLYVTDEGIYIQQAWAVLRQGQLSPYTYFYDHAPAGWLAIAAWVSILPAQLDTFGNANNTGRALMLVVHLANVALLFWTTHRLSGSRIAAFLATFLFNLSPLAIFYQRQVLLDNLMVFWILLSLYLAAGGGPASQADGSTPIRSRPAAQRGVVTPILSGLALGIAVLTKENAIFFVPVIGYLLHSRVRGKMNYRFALSFWAFTEAAIVSMYFLYAVLKDELFPSGFNFDLNSPPADHVSLLYTIWWQLHRSQGSIFDRDSLVWQLSLGSWLPKDTFILATGAAAMVGNLILGLARRQRRGGYLVASLLAASYAFYLARGSLMLEFYVVPLLPFLAMNLGMFAALLLQLVPALARVVPVAAFVGLMLLHPTWGYVQVVDEFGKVVPHDLYKLDLTTMQAQQLKFIRKNIPADAKLIIDDDLWADLHGVRPFYKWAHSHWKASADPDVRDKLFGKDWRNIDYVVMSNKMRIAMEQNNADGRENWILEALDHAEQSWALERGDVKLEVYRIRK